LVTAIGVLCARVRVEEKQIIAAIGHAGLLTMPVSPTSAPLPPGPASPEVALVGELLVATTGETMTHVIDVLIDRATNRSVAAAILPLVRMNGVRTIDAGVAATGTRLQALSALALAGLPRPVAFVGFAEVSSAVAAARIGYPSTMLGLMPGSSTTQLHDADTADAVIEHRVVLGEESEAIVLIQAGAPPATARTLVHVVDGRAIAIDGADTTMEGVHTAEAAARALGASLIAVELARTDEGLVIWDVHPAPDFRLARLLGDRSVAEAVAAIVAAGPAAAASVVARTAERGGEARHGFAVSA